MRVDAGGAAQGEALGEGMRHPEAEKINTLRAHWQPIFERGATGASARQERAARPTTTCPSPELVGPPLSCFGLVLSRVRSSVPGPDGLRYKAWCAGGELAASVLHGLLWTFLGGELARECFAEALMMFLPTSEVEREGTQARHSAVAMRPLGLMNTDGKVVLVAVAHFMSAHVAAHARDEQRGTAKGRQNA